MKKLIKPKKRLIKICELCGKKFEVLPSEDYRKFCSHKCADTYNAKKRRENQKQHVCKQCGKVFWTPHSQKGSFCSKKCQILNQKNGEIRLCLICGKSFYAYKKSKQKTCSKECGRKLVQKITIGQIRSEHVEVTCEYCGKIIDKYPSFIKGQKHFFCDNKCHYAWRHKNNISYKEGYELTGIQKKQISQTIKRKIRNGEYDLENLKMFERGENHPCWKGGISFYYSEDSTWQLARRQALKRDKYICQICGNKDIPLDVHHKIPFRVCKSHDLDNLLSVCRSCHAKLDNPLYKFRKERGDKYVRLVST